MLKLLLPLRYLVFLLIAWAAYRGRPFFVYVATAVAATVLLALTPDVVRNNAWDLLDHTLLVGSVALLGFLALATMEHQHLVEERLRQATLRNPLTGWFNEQGLGRILAEAPSQSRLIGVDIQNFKQIVELLGLLVARDIEKGVADLLQIKLPEACVFAHPSEGFFVIQLPVEAAIETIVSNLEELLSERQYSHDEYNVRLQVAVGSLSLAERQEESPADTLAALMLACQLSTLWHDTPSDRPAQAAHEQVSLSNLVLMRRNQLSLLEELKEMLQRPPGSPSQPGLWLASQTIQSIQSGSGSGIEILLRWTLSDGTHYSPGVFIPLAERYGLMPRVDRWVIRHALQTLSANRPQRHQLDKVSINLSGDSVSDPRLFEFIESSIHFSQLPPGLFCFEVTESMRINEHKAAFALLNRLRTLGCHISLDDFGTGTASFEYLKTLPLDYVKIDGSFIRNLLTSSVDHEIVKAICYIARALKLKTVAEYVETPEHLELLREWGVDYAQGYGIDKPRYFEEYLRGLQ